MPLDGFGQDFGLLGEFLGVVFAKVSLVGRSLVKGENVVGGLEFGYCYKTDLSYVRYGSGGSVKRDGGFTCVT